MTVVGLTPELLAPVAGLFDDYRRSYGRPAAPDAAAAWLRRSGLLVFAALRGERPCGVITVLPMPASLRLATFWAVRDLYVEPAARRGGVARELLGHVIGAARRAGALRVSLQTETGNAPAHALYASLGFTPVDGLDVLNLPLGAD